MIEHLQMEQVKMRLTQLDYIIEQFSDPSVNST